MNQEEFITRIAELLDEGKDLKQVITDAAIKFAGSEYNAGFIKDAESNYIFPKIFLSALFAELAWQFEPLTKGDKKTLSRIKPLVRID